MNLRNLSITGTPVAVDNCNAFGLPHYRGGVPAVNMAYELALSKGWIQHWRQVSVNSCMAKGQWYVSRSDAIGVQPLVHDPRLPCMSTVVLITNSVIFVIVSC